MTVETCDETAIPAVKHTTHKIHHFTFYENGTSKSPLPKQNFSLPKHVTVTYTCNRGYRLQDPNNNVIGCEYVTTPRNGTKNVTAKAVWTSADGIVCQKGGRNGDDQLLMPQNVI